MVELPYFSSKNSGEYTIFAIMLGLKQYIDVCKEKVFKSLFLKYSKGIRDYLYMKSGDLELSEDLMQDVFLKFWEKCKEVVFEKSNLLLYSIAKRLLIDKIRRKKVALSYRKKLPAGERKEMENPQFKLELKEFKQKLETILDEMPEKNKEVFVMSRIEKLKYREIADRLGLSQKAVEKRMSNALKIFYTAIKT